MNQNIWCIEISRGWCSSFKGWTWTKTYDVLKLQKQTLVKTTLFLNQNIWCIEIKSKTRHWKNAFTWTKTYDVLKFEDNRDLTREPQTWTKTYDVLKSSHNLKIEVDIALNQNIWCIEIQHKHMHIHPQTTWTKTYDVLKLVF